MYKFLNQYLHKNIASIIIVAWYIFLILYNLRLIFANLEDGKFRYIGW